MYRSSSKNAYWYRFKSIRVCSYGWCCQVLLDGTWDEAKKLLERSPVLHQFPSLHLDLLSSAGGCWEKSAFVIKTQPNPQCMSTVETVAHTLAVLEGDQSIVTRMIHPLNTLCQIQLNHGAVTHDDKVTKKQYSHWPLCKELLLI